MYTVFIYIYSILYIYIICIYIYGCISCLCMQCRNVRNDYIYTYRYVKMNICTRSQGTHIPCSDSGCIPRS